MSSLLVKFEPTESPRTIATRQLHVLSMLQAQLMLFGLTLSLSFLLLHLHLA